MSWLREGLALAAGLALAIYAAGGEPLTDKPARTDQYGDPLPRGAVARMGTVRLRQLGHINSMAFSPDGKILAAGADDHFIRLWEVGTGKEVGKIAAKDKARSVAFSPDGKTLASVGGDNHFYLWNAVTGREIRRTRAYNTHWVDYVDFSPDGKLLVTASSEEPVRLWDPAGGQLIRTIKEAFGPIRFSADGKTFIGRTKDSPNRRILQWDTATGKVACTISAENLWCPVLAPDGKTVAAVEYDGAVRIWEPPSGREILKVQLPIEGIWQAFFSTDGRTLLCGDRKTIVLLDVSTGKVQHSFAVCKGLMRWSPDGNTLAVVDYSTTIRLWNVGTGRELHPLGGHHGPIAQIVFSADGNTLISGGCDGTIRFWESATGRELRKLTGVGYDVRLALSPDGRTLAGASAFPDLGTTPIWLWNTSDGKEIFRIDRFKGSINSLAFAPNGKTLAGIQENRSSEERFIRTWDVATGKELLKIAGPSGYLGTTLIIAFSPDGKYLAIPFGDKSIRLWDVATGREAARLELAENDAITFTFSPDGKTMAVADWGKEGNSRIHLIEIASGSEIREVGGEAVLHQVVFSPDGRIVAAGSNDGEVCLWDTATGCALLRLPDNGQFLSVAFAPDGRRLAVAGHGAAALVLDLAVFALKPGLPGRELSVAELDKLWTALAGPDAIVADKAFWIMVASPEQTVAYLRKHMQVPKRFEERLDKLMVDLDDDKFAVRQAASEELHRIGAAARPALDKVLAGKPSLEVRRRVDSLLQDLGPRRGLGCTGSTLRNLRALHALERIGTGAAVEVLKALAAGPPKARETQDAQAALERLARRPLAKN